MQIPHPSLVLFVFVFSIYGLANAIAVLKIGQFIFGLGHCPEKDCTEPDHPKDLRRFLGRIPYFGDLFYCPPCLAFWFGIALSRAAVSPCALVVESAWEATLMDGLLASGCIWILHLVAERLGHGLDL